MTHQIPKEPFMIEERISVWKVLHFQREQSLNFCICLWGAHVIGMTNLTEAKLAREAESPMQPSQCYGLRLLA